MATLTDFSQVNVGDDTDHEILQKYWYYRWRLRNDFVFIGENQGESLPFSERNVGVETGPKVGMGDATQLLAIYISTLVTEDKLLSETNRYQDLPMTRTELYYAFLAFERLDFLAETEFPFVTDINEVPSPIDQTVVDIKEIERNSPQYPASLNGFFTREDYPKEFFGDDFSDICSRADAQVTSNLHYQHFNSSITRQGSASPVYSLEECVDLKFYRYEINPLGATCSQTWPVHWSADERAGDGTIPGAYVDMDLPEENLPSTDQIGGLLQSFLMTKVSMPDNQVQVTLLDGSVEFVNFVELAQQHATRLINFLKDSGNGWEIEIPNGEKITNDKGGAVGQYSFPISQIGNMITDQNLALGYYYIPVGFHNVESVVKRTQWNTYQHIPSRPLDSWAWNSHSDVLMYSSVSCSWTPQNFSPFTIGYHNTRVPHTTQKVSNSGSYYGYDPLHMMVMGYLHGVDMNAQDLPIGSYLTAPLLDISLNGTTDYVEYTKKSLETAPCAGPYNYVEFDVAAGTAFGDQGVKGWNTSKRWHNAAWRAFNNYIDDDGEKRGSVTTGYYSGLDFMILHNLYYLNSSAQLPVYVNYIDRHYEEDLLNSLSSQSPLTIGGYETLTADNTIEDQLDVTYKASTQIHLTTGFHVEAGADFHAHLEDMVCGVGSFKSASTDAAEISNYGLSATNSRHIYADSYDKFEHLYVLPDTISQEMLESNLEKMTKINLYQDEVMSIIQECNLDLMSNLVTDEVKFSTDSSLRMSISYHIYDINGKQLLEGPMSNYGEGVNVSSLPAGMYLIKVIGDSQACSAKFSKL